MKVLHSISACREPSDVVINSIMDALMPLFDDNVSDKLRRTLTRDPILIQCNENCSKEEVKQLIERFSTDACIHCCSADSRLIERYPIKKMYQSMGRADFQETAGSNIITNLEIGAILSFSPCIIHIENFDMVFNDPAQQHNSLPEDSLDEIFGAALVSFIKDLNDEIDANTQKARSNKFDTIVVVVVSTKYGSKIKPSLRSVFGSEIQISGSNLKAKEYLGSIHSRLGSDVLLHAEAEQVLVSHMEAHNMGETAVGQFLSEVKLTALARQKFSMWMDSISPACSAVLSTPRRNVRVAAESSASQIDASSNIMLTITAGDVQRTIWEMPCMNGFDTTNGSNGRAQQQHKQATIAPVHWADIGGLDRVRKEILDVLELPFQYPELFGPGCPRRQGVLLYGPPGTGKTLVARAVATECGMSFISVKGPELLDMYVGESEKNVREIFQRARDAAPCVLFFDEIDSLAPARARNNASAGGGIMDRMVSQLVTEMDAVVTTNAQACAETHAAAAISAKAKAEAEKSGVSCDGGNGGKNSSQQGEGTTSICVDNGREAAGISGGESGRGSAGAETAKANGKFVFIIGATNRPDLLDPALLRPGRFDRKIYLGVCKDIPSRLQILRAQTRKFSLAPTTDLAQVAAALPENITGADIGAVTSAAYTHALQRKLENLRLQAITHIRCGGKDTLPAPPSSLPAVPLPSATKHASIRKAEGTHMAANDPYYDCGDDGKEPDDWAVQAYINRLPQRDLMILVEQEDLLQAARTIRPSVVDLAYYESLGATYDDSSADI